MDKRLATPDHARCNRPDAANRARLAAPPRAAPRGTPRPRRLPAAGQCDAILLRLWARLGPAAWRWPHGKHVVLMFEEQAEYYRYLSRFHKEGSDHNRSSGVFLRRGYAHTALPYGQDNLSVLMHEFVHLCLSRHPSLPLWLNEGLAAHLERATFDSRGRGFDRKAARAQRTFWTAETIQHFWFGDGFHAEKETPMSYNLAELLVGLLTREFKDLGEFIVSARRHDAGESAAREHFDLGLGEVAAAVLGEGDWRPRPAVASAQSAVRTSESPDAEDRELPSSRRNCS